MVAAGVRAGLAARAAGSARPAGVTDDLVAFLRLAASEPFRFGEWDCAMLLANWVRFRTGQDPAASIRGHYRTRIGWMRLAKREGGLAALVGRLADRAGLTSLVHPGDTAIPGDIGLIAGPEGPTGAIRIARGWIQKSPRGVSAGSAFVLAAWRLT